jgi:hypothetical protein
VAEPTKDALIQRLKNIRATAKKAAEHGWAVGVDAGHEVLGYGVLAMASASAGYWKDKYKLPLLEVDPRPVIGVVAQVAGFGAMLMGHSAGRFGVTIGRGFNSSFLAEQAYIQGHKMTLPDKAARDAVRGTITIGAQRQIPSGVQASGTTLFTSSRGQRLAA